MPPCALTSAASSPSKVGTDIIGNRARVRVVKNKVAPPFRTAEFDIMYNEGISKVGDILDLGTNMDIITKRGAFYSYGDIRLGQGRENSKEFLRQNLDISNEIEQAIRQQSLEGDHPWQCNVRRRTPLTRKIKQTGF